MPRAVIAALVAAIVAVGAPTPGQGRDTPLPASDPLHAELYPEFRAFFEGLTNLRQLDRRPIDATLDVILVQATTARVLPGDAPREARDRQQAVGAFVVDRRQHRRRFTVDIVVAGPRFDTRVTIREVACDRLTIGIDGGPYSQVRDRVTYFWDLGANTVVERRPGVDVAIEALHARGSDLWAIARDGHRQIVARVRGAATGVAPAQAEILTTIAGDPIAPILVSRVDGDVLELLGSVVRYRLLGDRWEVGPNPDPAAFRHNAADGAAFGLPDVQFWAPRYRVNENVLEPDRGRRLLIGSSEVTANATGPMKTGGLWEIVDGAPPKFYPLPVPDYATFARLRPRRVADGYTRDQTHLEAEIGRFALAGRRLWVGTSFYDGEGTTGVGGLGYFDLDSRTWRMFRPRGIVDWSASAMLVENTAVWVGLVTHPEGRDVAGGLLRWDARTHAHRIYAIPDTISVLRHVGPRLYLGTENGLYVLDGERLVHARFRHERGGAFSLVVEPVGGGRGRPAAGVR